MKRSRALLMVVVVLLLGGVGLSFGAVASWSDQHSGTPGKAKVAFCTGHEGRYAGGVHCRGSWVTGGSLAQGGEVAFGPVTGAGRGDVGHTVDVRIHGSDHATVPALRVSIILAALGLPMLVVGLLVGREWWRGTQTRPSSPEPSASGTSP
jgi:hypothetical protein